MTEPGRLEPGAARGRGLGKLVLCGEHAVVYGHPALAVAVDRCTTVTLSRDLGAPPVEGEPRLAEALSRVVEPDVAVRIDSDLPIGRGMGSSAALAVALVRARAALQGEPPPGAEVVFERAMPVERVFHGNPSGIDVAVSSRGGLIRYQRPPGRSPTLTHLPAPRWRIVVLDSGQVGDTAELVAQVASRRPGIDDALDRIGALADHAGDCLDDLPALGALLNDNHELLRRIGVSTPDLDALVRLARDAGAYGAKLAGAGGGGVVLALVADPEPLLRLAADRGVAAFECRPAPEEPR